MKCGTLFEAGRGAAAGMRTALTTSEEDRKPVISSTPAETRHFSVCSQMHQRHATYLSVAHPGFSLASDDGGSGLVDSQAGEQTDAGCSCAFSAEQGQQRAFTSLPRPSLAPAHARDDHPLRQYCSSAFGGIQPSIGSRL